MTMITKTIIMKTVTTMAIPKEKTAALLWLMAVLISLTQGRK